MVTENSGPGRNLTLQPEQMSAVAMKDVPRKSTKDAKLVVNSRHGKFATGRACMLVVKHCQFVVREVDKVLFSRVDGGGCGGVYKVALKRRVRHTRENVVQDDAQGLVLTLDPFNTQRRSVLWDAQSGHLRMQKFLAHITPFALLFRTGSSSILM